MPAKKKHKTIKGKVKSLGSPVGSRHQKISIHSTFLKVISFSDLRGFWGLMVAWLVVMAGFFSLRNYNQLLPEGNPFGRLPTEPILLWGFVAMVIFWRLMPPIKEDASDLSPWSARIWFWGFMVLGFVLRMQHPDRPSSIFWDDNYIVTTDIRNIIDYKEHPLLFSSGWREPLFPYLTAFLWVLFPKMTGVYAVNLSTAVIDVVALWASYLLGKEIGGRRMGVLLIGVEAICKAIITQDKIGYGTNTAILACVLATLFFFRVLRKPDLSHFIQWGLALGFGALCYVPYRPWTPVMIGVVCIWVFSDLKERRFNLYRIILGPGLLLAWAFLFLYKNSIISEINNVAIFFTNTVSLLVVGLLFCFCYVKMAIEEHEKNKGFSKLFGWATGVLTTTLVMTPFFLHPHYSTHTSDISVFSKNYAHSTAEGFQNLWNNIFFVHGLMFGQVNDVACMPALGDSFCDFYMAACGFLGLAYFLARPTWIKAYMVALYVVSLVPGVMANAPHSLRLAAVLFPVLLVGAWGLNRLWLAFIQDMPKGGNLFFAVLLILFGAWEMKANAQLIKAWLLHKSADLFISDKAGDELPNHRVYIAPSHSPGFYTGGLDIRSDGKEFLKMNDSNEIDLLPGEGGKDLAILVAGVDTITQKQIETEFPGVVWQKSFIYYQGPTENPFLWCAEIPFDRVKEGDKGLFHVRHTSPWTWKRSCYGRYGLGRGLILYQDRVVHWNDTPPPYSDIDWNNSMRVEGDWNIKTAGTYILKSHTANILWFFLDGKKILEVDHSDGLSIKTYKVNLEPGAHHVELVTAFTWEHRVPTITVIPPGSSTEIPLDDFAANQAEP